MEKLDISFNDYEILPDDKIRYGFEINNPHLYYFFIQIFPNDEADNVSSKVKDAFYYEIDIKNFTYE